MQRQFEKQQEKERKELAKKEKDLQKKELKELKDLGIKISKPRFGASLFKLGHKKTKSESDIIYFDENVKDPSVERWVLIL